MPSLRTAINKITMAGPNNSKLVCEEGSYKIKTRIGGVWTTVVSGLSKEAAERILEDAHNRTILG